MEQSRQGVGFFRQCQRFQPKERADECTDEDAIVYLKLRKDGLNKRKALEFSQRQHCRIDCSPLKFGPPEHKIFTNKNDKSKMLNGWQMVGKLHYQEVVSEYYQEAKKDLGLLKVVNKSEQQRLKYLKEYYENLENKYNLSTLSKQEMVTKLRSLTTDKAYLSRTPKYQMRKGNEVYYELADYFHSVQAPEPTLVTQMEAFDEIVPRHERTRYRLESKVLDKPAPFYENSLFQRRSKLMNELTVTYTGRMSIREPRDDYKMAIRKTFKQDYNDSQYISRLYDLSPAPPPQSSSFTDFEESAKRRVSILSRRTTFKLACDEVIRGNRFQQQLDDLANLSVRSQKYISV